MERSAKRKFLEQKHFVRLQSSMTTSARPSGRSSTQVELREESHASVPSSPHFEAARQMGHKAHLLNDLEERLAALEQFSEG